MTHFATANLPGPLEHRQFWIAFENCWIAVPTSRQEILQRIYPVPQCTVMARKALSPFPRCEHSRFSLARTGAGESTCAGQFFRNRRIFHNDARTVQAE